MEQKFSKGSMAGLVLIGLGALLLFQTMGVFHYTGRMLMAMIFLGGGALTGVVFLQDRRNWWAIFPTFMLGFIGLIMMMDVVWPRFDANGFLFLGGLGLSFLAVHGLNRQWAWPVIPGGFFLSLAAVTGINHSLPWFNDGLVLFVGWAVTFAAYYWLAGQRRQDQWALVVAAVCLGVSLLILGGILLKLVLPLLLVLLGVYLLIGTQRKV